jgi:hypothetical protein
MKQIERRTRRLEAIDPAQTRVQNWRSTDLTVTPRSPKQPTLNSAIRVATMHPPWMPTGTFRKCPGVPILSRRDILRTSRYVMRLI